MFCENRKFRVALALAVIALGVQAQYGNQYQQPTVKPAAFGPSYRPQVGIPAKQRLDDRIKRADYCLVDFEKEVARQRGGEKVMWHYKTDALDRVKSLVQDAPDDPRVQALFARAKKALKLSLGRIEDEVDPAWTQYKRNEEDLRKMVWKESEAYWKSLLASEGTNVLSRAWPAPDVAEVPLEAVKGKLVVLDSVAYPANQFYGGSGEYISCGKPSEGYYFVKLNGRHWLGAYEAAKRYRNEADSSMLEVHQWTVLGRITGVTAENPNGMKSTIGNFEFGWVVEPIALMVPGCLVSYFDAEAPSSGRFVAEDKVAKVKEGWYTIKEIPPNATPEELMNCFVTAIKEKNFWLYFDCIDKRRREGFNSPFVPGTKTLRTQVPTAFSDIKYHWELHQERFHGEYVHVKIGKAKIVVAKGFDRHDTHNDFFLDDDEKDKLEKANGVRQDWAIVETTAIDENGKQLGSPHPHKLVRWGNGRWYVEDYAPRF